MISTTWLHAHPYCSRNCKYMTASNSRANNTHQRPQAQCRAATKFVVTLLDAVLAKTAQLLFQHSLHERWDLGGYHAPTRTWSSIGDRLRSACLFNIGTNKVLPVATSIQPSFDLPSRNPQSTACDNSRSRTWFKVQARRHYIWAKQ